MCQSTSALLDAHWPFLQQAQSLLHVDFGVPFHSHCFLVVVVGVLYKWVGVLSVTTPFARAAVSALQVFGGQGLLEMMVSDNAPAFANEECLSFPGQEQDQKTHGSAMPSSFQCCC